MIPIAFLRQGLQNDKETTGFYKGSDMGFYSMGESMFPKEY